MDAGHTPKSILQKLQKSDRVGTEKNKVSSESTGAAADSVSVSTQAKTRLAVKKAYDDLPQVNSDKVNYFRQQIAEGSYKPITKEVVVKIFDNLIGQR